MYLAVCGIISLWDQNISRSYVIHFFSFYLFRSVDTNFIELVRLHSKIDITIAAWTNFNELAPLPELVSFLFAN